MEVSIPAHFKQTGQAGRNFGGDHRTPVCSPCSREPQQTGMCIREVDEQDHVPNTPLAAECTGAGGTQRQIRRPRQGSSWSLAGTSGLSVKSTSSPAEASSQAMAAPVANADHSASAAQIAQLELRANALQSLFHFSIKKKISPNETYTPSKAAWSLPTTSTCSPKGGWRGVCTKGHQLLHFSVHLLMTQRFGFHYP